MALPLLLQVCARSQRKALCARALLARLALGSALVLLGCAAPENDDTASNDSTDAPSSTGSGMGGPSDQGITLGFDSEDTSCSLPEGFDEVFADDVYDYAAPPPRVLYSWTSAEQEKEMRAGGDLLLVGEHPTLGRGIAMDAMFAHVASEEATPLATALSKVFTEYRYSWHNPWATRLGWPGEDYGNRLVRMVLRDDAWVGQLSPSGHVHSVQDLDGNAISDEEALAHVERIAALFYQHEATEQHEGPTCFVGTFTAFGGDGGYREFIVGNEAMVQEWSLGTEQVLTRLEDDIAALTAFLEASRPCPPVDAHLFNATVSCEWGRGQNAYLESLAVPSELYVPTSENLIRLIEALTGDLFEVDPYVVTPAAPSPSPLPR